MKYARVVFGALALVATAAGCSKTEQSPGRAQGVTNMQGAATSEQDQGWAALVEADRETNRLAALRDATNDPFTRDSITHDLQAIRVRSDALMDEMTAGDGRSHDAQIRRLAARLERSLSDGVATEMQAAEPQTLTPPTTPP